MQKKTPKKKAKSANKEQLKQKTKTFSVMGHEVNTYRPVKYPIAEAA